MRHIGFTGTQQGMTHAQHDRLEIVMAAFDEEDFVIHHGDCVGADAEFHDNICHELPNFVGAHLYPCDVYEKRAHLETDVLSTARIKRPLDRNKDIVNACDVLIAAPKDFVEELRSGTWSTVRYARKKGKPVFIVWPNGETT